MKPHQAIPKRAVLQCAFLLYLISPYIAAAVQANVHQRSLAVFYGAELPVNELSHFDDVIVEPGHEHGDRIKRLQSAGSIVFAYLSVGEVQGRIARSQKLPESWFVARNREWHSRVVDLTSADWRHWFLHKQLKPLMDADYDGVFLDTLDSYRLGFDTAAELEQQRQALKELMNEIRALNPSIKLYLNRGFEVLDDNTANVHAVAAESLYQRWNPQLRQYQAVPEDDRTWLLAKLNAVRASGMPISVLDYVPMHEPELLAHTRQQISDHGFTPWVSVPEQNVIGLGSLTVMPRRVLVVYDSSEGDLAYHPAHSLLGHAYDYLGLRAEYHDLQSGVPVQRTANLYAGVLTFLSGSRSAHFSEFEVWLYQQLREQTRVVIFQGFPFRNTRLLQQLGVQKIPNVSGESAVQFINDQLLGFETDSIPQTKGETLVRVENGIHDIQLSIIDQQGQHSDPVFLSNWGGVALAPYTYVPTGQGRKNWLIDPIEFLAQAFDVKGLPVPDTTTENGRRILLSHVDGDGFSSRAELRGRPLAAKVVYENLLKKYSIPHTVSVITSDMKNGNNAGAKARDLARAIFALPNVEAASHSETHPFHWQAKANNNQSRAIASIARREYTSTPPDVEREVLGSVDYINSELLPSGKNVEVMLWTGYAVPGDDAVALTKKIGIANLNGGDTRLTRAFPSTTQIYPQARPTQGGLQVYAPVTNENMYTNEWLGPFYGFRKVIETFELTDYPRRHKPISIYWHFYSGTKQAALRALHDVYDWSLAQPHTAMRISDFAKRVNGSQNVSMAQHEDGSISVKGLGELRTLRIPLSLGVPDIMRSSGIAGYLDLPQGRYLHLSDSSARLYFAARPENVTPFLQQANGLMNFWRVEGQAVKLRLSAYEPLTFNVHSKNACRLQVNSQWFNAKKIGQTNYFKLDFSDTDDALLVCK